MFIFLIVGIVLLVLGVMMFTYGLLENDSMAVLLGFIMLIMQPVIFYAYGYTRGQIDSNNGKNYVYQELNGDGVKEWKYSSSTTQPFGK